MRSGGTPNLAFTPATSSVSLLIVLISVTCSLTSCARSLSPVEMTTWWPLCGGHAGQRADRVVGLDARHLEHRPAEQPHHLVDRLDLLRQVVGHRRARGLVLGVPVVAEGLALGVEDAGRVLGRVLLAQLLQHRDHAVDRAGRARRRAPRRSGMRVVGAVEVARAVHQQQGLVASWRRLCGSVGSAWRGIEPPCTAHRAALRHRRAPACACAALRRCRPGAAARRRAGAGAGADAPSPKVAAHRHRGRRRAHRRAARARPDAAHRRHAQGGARRAYEIIAGDRSAATRRQAAAASARRGRQARLERASDSDRRMAVFTEVSFDEAAALVDAPGIWRADARCSRHPGGIENTNYFVDTDAGPLRADAVRAPDVRAAAVLPAADEAPGASAASRCPGRRPMRQRRRSCTRSTASPRRWSTACRAATSWRPTPRTARSVGAMLARMHLAGARLPAARSPTCAAWPGGTRPCRWCCRFLDAGAARAARQRAGLPAAARRLAGLRRRCRAAPIHADLFRDNVMFDEHAATTGSPASSTSTSPASTRLLFDIAVCLNDWCIDLDQRPPRRRPRRGLRRRLRRGAPARPATSAACCRRCCAPRRCASGSRACGTCTCRATRRC